MMLGRLCASSSFVALALAFTITVSQAGTPPPSPGTCSGAWTGSITLTENSRFSNDKTTERISKRGQDKTSTELTHTLDAHVSVTESPEEKGTSIGKASINVTNTLTTQTVAVERNFCQREKRWQEMTGNFSNQSYTGGSGRGDASVSIGVSQDGTYGISVGVPSIEGTTSGLSTASYSGQCWAKPGSTVPTPPTKTTIQGASFSTDGKNHVDPKNPNRLSGSQTISFPGGSKTLAWSLNRCGTALRLTDLTFEEPQFPKFDNWQEVVEPKGTIDGNPVKIKAKVLNPTGESKVAKVIFKETYKGDKWDGTKPDADLKESATTVRLDPGDEKTVEMVWDSSGYAWYDDGRPRLIQRIKAELEDGLTKVDEMTRNLKIAPKPVVLVHGAWSTWQQWAIWQNIFTTVHSYDWKAFPVGEKPENGVMDTGSMTKKSKLIAENARALQSYIQYAQEDRNAWHIDIVAHELGGLIARWYIDQLMGPSLVEPGSPDSRPKVSHLVMLGTPNMGSRCADAIDLAKALIGSEALHDGITEMRLNHMEVFNKVHTQRKGVKFSSLAGNPLPVACYQVVPNDGFVPVSSAHWVIKDTGLVPHFSGELTGTTDFSSFVKPRLAIGPKGNHNLDPPDIVGSTSASLPSSIIGKLSATGADKPLFAKAAEVPPRKSMLIDIPVEAGKNFGLIMLASQAISATLIDNKGAVAGTSLAATPASSGWFRSIFVDHPVTAGTWKLKLDNTGTAKSEAVITTWKDAVP